jgi:DNA-binding transcriptional regulator LsrR (DeoR family)
MPRAKSPADTLQIARLFYNDERTKNQIAEKLKIDPRTVNAALKRARDTGMVEIKVHETALNKSLEDRLKEHYPHLKRVLTLPTLGPIATPEQHTELVRRFGVLAAEYFKEFMAEHHGPVHLAVSGGVSVFEAVNAIEPQDRRNLFIHVTALVGYGIMDKNASHLIPAINAGILWQKSGRYTGNHLSYATVPPLPTDLDALAQMQPIKDVLAEMEKVNFVFAGLGTVKPDQNTPQLPKDAKSLRNQVSMVDMLKPVISEKELIRAGAEADFSYVMVDRDGNAAIDPKTKKPFEFFLSGGYGTEHSGIEFYKRLTATKGKKTSRGTVLAIAGPFKLPAIRAALKGKLMNIWVTDEDSARSILNEADEAKKAKAKT